MRKADLSVANLLSQSWDTFKRRPGISIGMWVVYVFFKSGGGADADDAGVIASLVTLAILLASGPIQGGYDLATLRLLRGDDSVAFTDMFAGFRRFEHLFLVSLVSMIVVVIGFILLIVPGVIVALALWPAFLLVMEDELGAIDALRAAWDLTMGYKLQLFVLALASAALVLLGMLAFGVGVLVAGPVIQLAWLAAYDAMREAESDAMESAPQAR